MTDILPPSLSPGVRPATWSARLSHHNLLLLSVLLSGCPCEPELRSETLAQAMSELVCLPVGEDAASNLGVERVDGCGLISLSIEGGYTGGVRYFSDRSGKQVGEQAFSDVPEEAFCNKHSARVGKTPERDAKTCPERRVYQCSSRGTTDDGGVFGVTDGCRAPSEPGCSTCCRHATILSFPQCEEWVDDGLGRYMRKESASFRGGKKCDAGCTPCADCTRAHAEQLMNRPTACRCVDEAPEPGKSADAAGCRAFCDESVDARSACRGAEL